MKNLLLLGALFAISLSLCGCGEEADRYDQLSDTELKELARESSETRNFEKAHDCWEELSRRHPEDSEYIARQMAVKTLAGEGEGMINHMQRLIEIEQNKQQSQKTEVPREPVAEDSGILTER